jgi:Tfp pilus assembly protein PilN
MSSSASSYLLPDVEPSWRFHKSTTSATSEPLDNLSDLKAEARSVVIGLPATACRTIGIILPTTEAALVPTMIEAQLEKRGIIIQRETATNYAWHMLGHGAGLTFASVDVLVNPFPSELVVPQAANYTAAPRLLQLPANDLVVMEEQALLVLAASYQGKLWHSHVLGTAEMSPPDLSRELEMAKLTLEAQEGFGALRGVTLVGERLSLLKSELKTLLTFPVDTVRSLEPNRAVKLDSFSRLLPAAVQDAQSSQAKRRKLTGIIGLTILAYTAVFALCWWYLQGLQKKQASLESEIASTNVPASEIRTTAQRWRSLEPAIDTARYPLMQLTQITGLMPPSGVLIKKFSAKPEEIEISGDSRDAQTATQFLEDLKEHPKLGRFKWDMPVPSVKDKVASFKIQGKLEG